MQRAQGPDVNWRRTADGIELYDEDNPDASVRLSVEAGDPPEARPFTVCPECGLTVRQRAAPGRHMVCRGCDTEFDTADGTVRGRADD